jgi:branched-chain amino acid transport system ATP-binding protein
VEKSADVILRVKDLVSSYGYIKALKGISLEVRDGELVSLLGSNGAGKSTLLKSIIGMVKIESGSIQYNNIELVGKKSHEIVPMGISIVPEGRKIFSDVTVAENLEVGTFSRAKDKAQDKRLLETVFELFPRLYERRKQMGGTLSGGEQQMLAVGRAIMSDPKLLLLDEPSMGLAPLIVEQVFHVIEKVKATGVTILLVEQNARMALNISDRAYVLSTGEITDEDTSKNMMKKDALLEAYLGKSKDKNGNS